MSHVRFPSPGALLGAILATLLAACASAPPSLPVPTGSRVMVSLEEPARGLRLVLANASHPDLQDVYSSRRADASLKLAPDQLIGELLASLDAAGLAQFGTSLDAPPPPSNTARLLVVRDGAHRLMERPGASSDAEAARSFGRLELVMNEYYQHVGALQSVANDGGAALFDTQRQPGVRP